LIASSDLDAEDTWFGCDCLHHNGDRWEALSW
jgi:hypothetical protein